MFAAYISVSRSVARFVPEAGMSEAAVLECIVDAVAVAHGDSDTHADANAKTAANSVHASCALDGAWVIDEIGKGFAALPWHSCALRNSY